MEEKQEYTVLQGSCDDSDQIWVQKALPLPTCESPGIQGFFENATKGSMVLKAFNKEENEDSDCLINKHEIVVITPFYA